MKKLAKSAVLVVVITIASKVLGLVREIVLANQFGTSYIMDAYAVAITLPSVLFSIFASGIANSYIPMYSRVKNDKKNRFFSNTITMLASASVILSFMAFISRHWITRIIAPGFSGKTFSITKDFVAVIVWILPIMAVFNILMAQAQAGEEFVFSNFCNQIVVNTIIIISIPIAARSNPNQLIWGYLLSYVAATILLAVHLRCNGEIRYSFVVCPEDDDFKGLMYLAIPTGLSLLVNQINSVIDKMFASSLGEGITSALSYANRVQLIPYSFAVSVVLSVCYPRMNHYFAQGNKRDGLYYAEKSILIALYIAIPIVLYIVVFSKPITSILFEHGAFSSEATTVTAACLLLYSIGIPFYAIREILSRTLAANLRQNQIFVNTVISVLCNALLDLVLVRLLGYAGLPLATSITGVIAFLLMSKDMIRLHLRFRLRNVIIDIVKIMGISLISVMLCWGIVEIAVCMIVDKVAFLIGLSASLVLYVLLGFVFKVEIIWWIYDFLPVGVIRKKK